MAGPVPIVSACPARGWPRWTRRSMGCRRGCGPGRSLGSSRCPEVPGRRTLPLGHPVPMQAGRGKTHSITAFSPWDSSYKPFPDVVKAVGFLQVAADLAEGTACRPSTEGQRQCHETNFFCTTEMMVLNHTAWDTETFCAMRRRSWSSPVSSTSLRVLGLSLRSSVRSKRKSCRCTETHSRYLLFG